MERCAESPVKIGLQPADNDGTLLGLIVNRVIYTLPLLNIQQRQWTVLETFQRKAIQICLGLPASSKNISTLSEAGDSLLQHQKREGQTPDIQASWHEVCKRPAKSSNYEVFLTRRQDGADLPGHDRLPWERTACPVSALRGQPPQNSNKNSRPSSTEKESQRWWLSLLATKQSAPTQIRLRLHRLQCDRRFSHRSLLRPCKRLKL